MTVRALRQLSLVALLTAVASASFPAASGAAESKGTTSIDLRGKAFAGLRDQGVKLTARRPARIVRGTLRLPVSRGLVNDAAYLNQGGALWLTRKVNGKRRTLKLTALQLRLDSRPSVLATIGGRRITAFSLAVAARKLRLNEDIGSAKLSGARLSISRTLGARIKRALDLARRPSGALGVLGVEALVGGTPKSQPVPVAPPAPPAPVGAVPVSNMRLTWSPRNSWVRYVSGAPAGEGVIVGNGATAAAPSGTSPCPDDTLVSSPPIPYSYEFTPASGWYDASNGTASLSFTGSVTFRWTGHTIDLTASDPEIAISATPQAVFRLNGSGGTPYPDQRAAILNLDLAGQPGVVGGTGTYSNARGKLTAAGAAVFAGFYPEGHPFGCVSVSFSVP